VRVEPALIEMDWGRWEGQQGAELRADPQSGFRDIEDWGWEYRPPDGESPGDVRARVQPWLDGLVQDTVAVCHIGVMRVVLAQAWGWNFQGPCPFAIKRNRLYVLTRQNDSWRAEPEPLRLQERPR
jgi:probable phosphoglycerate mutase